MRPLDAELSLPARRYADLLREWALYGAADESSRESQTVLERILGLSLSIQALETAVVEAAGEVTTCYEPPAVPPPAATILVVQADGKGVPTVQPPTQAPSVRLAKGQKRTKKEEAVVTGLYTIAPHPRTPQDVVAALLQDADRPEPSARPQPVDKELQATLEGKAVAMSRLAPRVAQREGPHIQQRVALTDGAAARQQPLVSHFPAHTLGLDILQATASWWETANALLGETHPPASCVGPRVPGAAAGRTDRRGHHGVGGRGEGPRVHRDATAGGAPYGRLLPPESTVYAR